MTDTLYVNRNGKLVEMSPAEVLEYNFAIAAIEEQTKQDELSIARAQAYRRVADTLLETDEQYKAVVAEVEARYGRTQSNTR